MLQTTTQIPATPARQAEQGDTRMALQRREEEEGRKRNPRQRGGRDELRNDEASVSIEALQLFLDNLLRSNDTRQDRDAGIAAAAQPVQETLLQPSQPRANFASPSAQAARAYASASRTSRRVPAMESAVVMPENPLSAIARPRLSAPEKELIAGLQENLAALTVRGVRDLSIQRGETFLGSLASSARLALDQTASL